MRWWWQPKIDRRQARIICLGFFCLLCLPTIQLVGKIFPEVKLTGATIPTPRPHWQWQSWLSGEFQTQAEKWFSERIGFRGFLVRTDNEINVRLFHQASVGAHAKIIIGKNHTLYERAYIENYHNFDTVSDAVLQAEVADLKNMAANAAQRGQAFVLVLSPSKAKVYPEFLPDEYRIPRAHEKTGNYERLKPLLIEAHIPFVDGPALFQKWKNQLPFMLFPRGGTHWTYYAACLIDNEIMQEVEKQQRKSTPRLRCNPARVDKQPTGTDRDLAELLNMWSLDYATGLTPHPDLFQQTPTTTYQPRLAIVGGSFVWTLLSAWEDQKTIGARNFFYYYHSLSTKEKNTPQKIETTTIVWDKAVLNQDAFIVEANETALGTIGFGMISDALAAALRAP